jgi:endonuclease YncB( thermonuclease family)
MAETFFTLSDGSPRAIVGIRRRANGTVQPLGQAVPDGDTVGVQLDGTGAVRFLGIDTPEKSFEQLLGGSQKLDGAPWEQFLINPFANGFPAELLESALAAHLQPRFGSGAAANHHRHAVTAGEALKQLIQNDEIALGESAAQFRYFVSFSYEVFDRYGRFLAFLNRNQPDPNIPGPRPRSYNERQLEAGRALPYFIWPNINPFREAATVPDAVPAPGTANVLAESGDLKRARDAVKNARANGLGVFSAADPLRFEAFEIRYLGRGEAPTRAVIDLSKNDTVMLRPQSYFTIPHPEDRLFVPSEFVPLFAAKGWQLEGFL